MTQEADERQHEVPLLVDRVAKFRVRRQVSELQSRKHLIEHEAGGLLDVRRSPDPVRIWIGRQVGTDLKIRKRGPLPAVKQIDNRESRFGETFQRVQLRSADHAHRLII